MCWNLANARFGRGNEHTTGEMVEFEVSGDKIEAVHMIPGWTHNNINMRETENLVTVMICNEIFNPKKPDMVSESV